MGTGRSGVAAASTAMRRSRWIAIVLAVAWTVIFDGDARWVGVIVLLLWWLPVLVRSVRSFGAGLNEGRVGPQEGDFPAE
jgi:hypothetical protein